LLHPHRHFPIVEHALKLILHIAGVLRHSLVQDIDFMLQLRALGAHLLRRSFAIILDFGAEFTTRCAEEIGLL